MSLAGPLMAPAVPGLEYADGLTLVILQLIVEWISTRGERLPFVWGFRESGRDWRKTCLRFRQAGTPSWGAGFRHTSAGGPADFWTVCADRFRSSVQL